MCVTSWHQIAALFFLVGDSSKSNKSKSLSSKSLNEFSSNFPEDFLFLGGVSSSFSMTSKLEKVISLASFAGLLDAAQRVDAPFEDVTAFDELFEGGSDVEARFEDVPACVELFEGGSGVDARFKDVPAINELFEGGSDVDARFEDVSALIKFSEGLSNVDAQFEDVPAFEALIEGGSNVDRFRLEDKDNILPGFEVEAVEPPSSDADLFSLPSLDSPTSSDSAESAPVCAANLRVQSAALSLNFWRSDLYCREISSISGSSGFGSFISSCIESKTVLIFELGFQLPFGGIFRVSRQILPPSSMFG